VRRYGSILRRPGAIPPFLAAVAARLPISMTPLGMVLLVQSVRGAYAIAGVITAAYTVGVAVASPGWGALIDRVGQPRVIGPLGAASAAVLAVLTLGVGAGWSDPVLVLLAVGVGITFPPISPAMRAAWRVILTDDADRRAAYALEAVVVEVIFVGGPLALSGLLVLGHPLLPLLITSVLLGAGGLGYAATDAARVWRPEPHPLGDDVRGPSPLRSSGVLASLAVALLVAIGFGQLDVSLAATAQVVFGSQAMVGLLFMAIAGGSAVGGVLYGLRHWAGGEHTRLPIALAGFTVGLTVVTMLISSGSSSIAILMPVLFGAGFAIAPTLIMLGNLVDDAAPRDRLSEAQAWLTTAFTAGAAGGTALAGVLIDRGGPDVSFTGATVALVAASLIAAAGHVVWHRHEVIGEHVVRAQSRQ